MASDMQIAILQDAELVAMAYVSLLRLARPLGKLAVMAYFLAMANLSSLVLLGAMCVLMLIFGLCRNPVLSKASDRVNQKQAEVGGLVADTCQRYRLVADYAQRPQVNERFQQMLQEFHGVDVPAEVVKMNNCYFPKWLGPIFIGVFIAMDAPKVFTDDVSLGEFMAAIGIFTTISLDFEAVYKEVLDITKSIVLLKGFTKYFNLPTDLLLWKGINRQRRSLTMNARASVMSGPSSRSLDIASGEGVPFRSDTISIKVVDMAYSVGNLQLEGVNLSVQQGRLVAVVGPHGSGKATFLRLIAHTLFPAKGTIFVPTHLRLLHVTQEPLMMNLSLWKNLTFGITNPNDVDAERVKTILERLKMHASLEFIRKAQDAGWQDALTYTEIVKVHVARAFIMNAEVMVLQRPLHHFEATAAELILSMLKRHVLERGLCMQQGNAMRHRRPRTVFFSPETVPQARQADVIWQISNVSTVASTVHMALPKELQDGFERGLESSPMSLMNPTVALQLNDGAVRSRAQIKSSANALSDQIVNQI